MMKCVRGSTTSSKSFNEHTTLVIGRKKITIYESTSDEYNRLLRLFCLRFLETNWIYDGECMCVLARDKT